MPKVATKAKVVPKVVPKAETEPKVVPKVATRPKVAPKGATRRIIESRGNASSVGKPRQSIKITRSARVRRAMALAGMVFAIPSETLADVKKGMLVDSSTVRKTPARPR